MKVLVLGGTGEARALAAELVDDGVDVVSSLAGRVARPRLPVGEVRIGGFGGVDGLAAYLRAERVAAVVDATHPFAATISAHAIAACALALPVESAPGRVESAPGRVDSAPGRVDSAPGRVDSAPGRDGTPLLRLARPGWTDHPDAHRWHWADDHDEAAETVARLGSRVFLTTGRQALPAFAGPLTDHDVLARVVDPPGDLPPRWQLLLDRGPYTVDGERALMQHHGTEVLATKDSGGDLTRAKLDAAASLGVEVVVVRRPSVPAGTETVSDVGSAASWVRRQRPR